MKTINKYAFTKTVLVTKTLNFISNPKLISPDNLTFDFFNQFKNIESISVKDMNITAIPSNAFNGQLIHLKVLTFQTCTLKKIGSGAFSRLKNLESLQFLYTCFESVPENAFSFDKKSEKPFELTFDDYFDFNPNIFNEKSLLNIKRPTKLWLRMKPEIQYLNERVFLTFLSDNVNNFIVIIDCSDCRNYWLRREPNRSSRVMGYKCSNDKSITDQDNFKNCSNI